MNDRIRPRTSGKYMTTAEPSTRRMRTAGSGCSSGSGMMGIESPWRRGKGNLEITGMVRLWLSTSNFVLDDKIPLHLLREF